MILLATTACAPVQPVVAVPTPGDSYDVANTVLAEKYGFRLDLPRERWPVLVCDLSVDFSGSITWWRFCWASDTQKRTNMLTVLTKICYRPDVIEEKILKWYASNWPYTILKRESSESPDGRVVTHYTIHHWDHQDFLSMEHVWTTKASLVFVATTGKDKKGREVDFRRDFELVLKGVVLSGVAVSGVTP